MIVWGITALNHGSSIAVFNNGDFVNNTVYVNDIPQKFPIERPDRIYWYERPWLKKARQVYAGQYSTALDMSVVPSLALNKWGFGGVPITYTPHHASHAAAGYYTSPFNHCAVVVIDAIGEFECATIWEGKDNELKKVWSRSYPNSLGLFYSAFTKLIGLEPIKEEYILQQLSNDGDPDRFYIDVSYYLTRNLHRGVRGWSIPINTLQDRKDIAAAVQLVFEEQVELIMHTAKRLTRSNNLVYMGGCAMNSKTTERISKHWTRCWSLPDPGDSSSSIGAVLYHTKSRINKQVSEIDGEIESLVR